MPDASFQVTSFLGGEVSQAWQGRMDDPRYKVALNVCYNGIMLESGAWVRRPGFKFAGRTPNGAAARVMPFNFTSTAPYSMQLSDGRIWFRNGSAYVFQSPALNVIAISAASPAVVRCLQPHNLTSGKYGTLSGLGTSLPTLQNRAFIITVIDAYRFSIADDIEGPINGAVLGTLPAGVTWNVIYEVSTTYVKNSLNDWANIRVIQAETQAIMLNGRPPYILTALTQPTATQSATFDFRLLSFEDGPFLDPYNGNSFYIKQSAIGLTPSGVSGLITLQAAGLDGSTAPDIFAATDVGRQMRLYTAPPTWQTGGSYVNGAFVSFGGQTYQNLTGGTLTPGGEPDITPSQWTLAGGLRAFWIWGVIASFISTTKVGFQILGPGDFSLRYTTPIEVWRLGVYSDTTGFPTCGCYHEGRVWLGGAITNRFDASMSSGLTTTNQGPKLTMSPTAADGTVSSANGISYTLAAKDVNQILWMEPDQQGIICGTKGGEWLVQATTQNLPLSPTNIQAHRYTTTGCANIEPRRTPLTLAFVQKHQRKVMELFADVFSGRLTTPNLTDTAKHLTVGGLAELAYQQELSPTLWARRADGALIGCTYKRENLLARELPTFAAWHRHTHGGSRTFESICVSGNSDGTLDTLVAVTSDGNSHRRVEVLTDLEDETAGLTDAGFLDGSIVPSSYEIAFINDTPVALNIYGLWDLNGQTVTVWAGGLDVGDWAVSNGMVAVPFGDGVNSGPLGTSDLTGPWNAGGGGYLLTPAFVNSFSGAMPIVVGFTYTSQGQLVRPNAREDTGARNGPGFGKKRLNNMIAFLVVNTQGLEYGTSFDAGRMQPAYFKDLAGTTYAVNQLYSDIHWDTIGDDWSLDGRLTWQVTRPYPVTIASIGGYLKTNDY